MAAANQDSLPQPSARSPQRLRLTSLDRAVILVIALLILLIGGTIVLGDRVGVQVTQAAPLTQAHSTSLISVHFNETMNHDSATSHFRTDPAVPGTFSWSGSTMTFQPAHPLTPGSSYTVSIEPGALSDTGRAVLTKVQFSFKVLTPRVAYLYPADGTPQNIWIVDPADPKNPKQVTNSPTGIVDFGVSPDGTKIAFTESDPGLGTSDIKLLDLDTGGLQQLTNCANALCSAPVWRPDGKMIAYERVENDPTFGNSPPRIWLLDLTSTPATTQPLFQENQILGYDAQWSADGSRIALVDRSSASILIYDFNTGKIVSIASTAGTSGALSPDGKTLVYPDLVSSPDGSGAMLNTLRIAQVDTGAFDTLSDPTQSDDDQRAQWNPDGQSVAVARAQGVSMNTAQIILIDMKTKAAQPITTDPHYSNILFWWDPTGSALVVQRFPQFDANMQPNPTGKPEIWTIDAATGKGIMVANDGYLPHWVP